MLNGWWKIWLMMNLSALFAVETPRPWMFPAGSDASAVDVSSKRGTQTRCIVDEIQQAFVNPESPAENILHSHNRNPETPSSLMQQDNPSCMSWETIALFQPGCIMPFS
jgi:hypothetical protein